MLASGFPNKIVLPFAASATAGTYIRSVPVGSQIGIQPGAASYTDGFPPLTFLNPSAGGALIDGRDMNGILNALSALLMYYSAGVQVTYDSTFQSTVGGYPKGAIVQSATTPFLYWLSTADNNTTNPDTGGAGWVNAYQPPAGSTIAIASSTVPIGYLQYPTSPTNISRAAYPALYNAIGTTWGAGDGSTTFGMPWMIAGSSVLHNISNIGAASSGAVISHGHTTVANNTGTGTSYGMSANDPHQHSLPSVFYSSSPFGGSGSGNLGGVANATGSTSIAHTHAIPSLTIPSLAVNNTGGSLNSAAGTYLMLCVKY